MKGKKFFTWVVIIAICVVGYKYINSDSGFSGIKKDIISTLPDSMMKCYYIDEDGNKNLDILKVKDLKIDQEITDGNYKTVECTIELEGEYLKKNMDVTLGCVKYDSGDWQVLDFSEDSEPVVVPKCMPSESIASAYITENEGFKVLNKINEYSDLDNSEVVYFYTVGDVYDYISFVGDGVSCTAKFKYEYKDSEDIPCYRWRYTTENNTEIVWNVYGTWHIEASVSGNPPYRTADIIVNSLSEVCGTATYSYPCVNGNDYTGEYETSTGNAYLYTSGSNPLDAKCVLSGLENSSVSITCEGVDGSIGINYYKSTVTKN